MPGCEAIAEVETACLTAKGGLQIATKIAVRKLRQCRETCTAIVNDGWCGDRNRHCRRCVQAGNKIAGCKQPVAILATRRVGRSCAKKSPPSVTMAA